MSKLMKAVLEDHPPHSIHLPEWRGGGQKSESAGGPERGPEAHPMLEVEARHEPLNSQGLAEDFGASMARIMASTCANDLFEPSLSAAAIPVVSAVEVDVPLTT